MKLVIITGAPASGKSSIADYIGKLMNMDVISKDGYKIQLFEKYGFRNHDEKKKLSIKGEELMHKDIENHVVQNRDLIVDNNFKNYDDLRLILKNKYYNVDIKCICCTADYTILATRYNERISNGNRHPALYTLNQYPIIEGVSKFHPYITKDDVDRIQQNVREESFGKEILQIDTDNIEEEFDVICEKIKKFIER